MLLEGGADPCLRDNLGGCALLEACRHGHDQIIHMMISSGARFSPNPALLSLILSVSLTLNLNLTPRPSTPTRATTRTHTMTSILGGILGRRLAILACSSLHRNILQSSTLSGVLWGGKTRAVWTGGSCVDLQFSRQILPLFTVLSALHLSTYAGSVARMSKAVWRRLPCCAESVSPVICRC